MMLEYLESLDAEQLTNPTSNRVFPEPPSPRFSLRLQAMETTECEAKKSWAEASLGVRSAVPLFREVP